MKCFLKILFFILFTNLSIAQSNFILIDSVQLPSANSYQIKQNRNQDIFIIKDDIHLIKVYPKQVITKSIDQKNISHLNFSEQSKVALITNYKDLIILDENLNQDSESINLNQFQIYPSSIALIDDQLLWYFDPIEQRLIQWNYQSKKEIKKSKLLFFKEGDFIIEEIYLFKDNLFLKSQNWIYEYDFFGNFIAKIALKPHEYYLFSNNYIYLYNANSLTTINLLNQDISFTDNFFLGKDFIMDGDQLFAIKNNLMYIYTRIKN